MKRTKNVMKGLTTWFTQIIVVLGLITFSPHASERKPYSPEPTKTELSEAKK